jgi:hypothetical protein
MLKTYVSTSRSYMEMWTYHWRRLLPRLEKLLSTPLTSKSRREHAKMACKRSNFFVGPNPRGSDRLVRDLIPPFVSMMRDLSLAALLLWGFMARLA